MPLDQNDTVSTIGYKGRRIWLYPDRPKGPFMSWRTILHAIQIVVLLIGPWIDIAGQPAIRVNIPDRRIYFMGLRLFATDGSYLLFFFGFLIFSIFFMTAIFGRAWCGWSCPQTVFMETLIRPIEKLFEGSTGKRRKLDKAPWTVGKALRKMGKWAAYMAVAGAISTTFLAYFMGRDGILEAQFNPASSPMGTTFFVVLTGLLFFDFAYFREQTCIVVCPYGRFQSVLLDANSLAVNYDEKRGEPRGKKSDPNAADCVDCKRCVQVCPTGIDIRKGTQMECIQCMACIDACDTVMEKLERPKGLIRMTSKNAIEGGKTQIVRPRVVLYGIGMVAVLIAFMFTVSVRQPVELNLTRQQTAPFAQLPDDRIQNGTRLRIQNKTDLPRTFTVEVLEPRGGEMLIPVHPIEVPANETVHTPVFLILDAETAAKGPHFKLEVSDDHGYTGEVSIEFLTAASRGAQ